MCVKISYPSFAKARAALVALQRRGRPENGIHPCAECHAWHLTSHAKGRWRVLHRGSSDDLS
jgi:hypothetical protein